MIQAPTMSEVPIRFVVRNRDPDPSWLARLEEALSDEPSVEIVVDAARELELAGDAHVVALIEDGVVPLPGCCEAARATLADRDGVGAVAVKLFGPDGSLEAAGATVFADGSWEGISAGSHQVVAPWHEYVREVSGGLGLLFFDAAALAKVGEDPTLASIEHPVAWTAPIWKAGLRVLYQPDATAVRFAGASGSSPAERALVARCWATGLPTRPSRPDVVDDRAWWALVACDDMEASWR
jgi:hypothetical protein